MFSIELIIAVLVVAVFRKQVWGLIIWGKSIINKKIPTGVKIKQTVEEFKSKKNTLRESFHLLEKNKSIVIKQAAGIVGNGKGTYVDISALPEAEQFEDPTKLLIDSHNSNRYSDDFEVRLRGGSAGTIAIQFTNCEIAGDDSNAIKARNLLNIYRKCDAKAKGVSKLRQKLDEAINDLNSELDYIMAIEGLENVGDLDIKVDIDSIYAEINATEKTLEEFSKLD